MPDLPANAIRNLLDGIVVIARGAGEAILRHYGAPIAIERKQDDSPVTAADRDAEKFIVAALRALTPGVPIIAEEEVAAGAGTDAGAARYWLVDPLDGTREFISRNGEFTVNIALIEDARPTLGVVHAPALGLLYAGAESLGAYVEEGGARRPIRCRAVDEAALVVVSSRSHGDEAALRAFLGDCPLAAQRTAGSSLKFCTLARGEADAYPRLGRTMEWDTAAGHAVLRAAGGEVWSLADGRPLAYGKPGCANPHFLAAAAPLAPVLRARLPLPT